MARKFFDDPRNRERFFDLIRLGHGRYEALKAIGVDPQTFRAYWKTNEDFRNELEEAINASVEPILKTLRELAEEGDVSAIKEYMKHMAPPPRSEADRNTQKIDVTVTHELDLEKVKTIRELEERVQRRKESTEIYEIEEANEDESETGR